jgi:hypothetical protein
MIRFSDNDIIETDNDDKFVKNEINDIVEVDNDNNKDIFKIDNIEDKNIEDDKDIFKIDNIEDKNIEDDNYVTKEGKVICQVCKKEYNVITPAHLKKSHNMTMDEYKLKYPNASLVGEKTKNRRKYSQDQYFKTKQEENDEFKEFYKNDNNPEIEEINIKKEIEENDDEIIKEYVIEKSKDFDVLEYKANKKDNDIEINPIQKMKNRIHKQIKKYFPNTKIDYLIEEKSMIGNRLLYAYITDFCDPVLKVDIEFPDTFWHNNDMLNNSNRDINLERDG